MTSKNLGLPRIVGEEGPERDAVETAFNSESYAHADATCQPCSPLDAALAYAAAGLVIVPTNHDKVALIKWAKIDRPPTEAQVRGWWRKWPDAWIGLLTGHRSGLDVVDLDRKANKNGFDAVPDWTELTTVTAQTPSGSVHLYFRASGTRTTGSVIAPGVDTRGEGGLVILPPSGGRTWRTGSLPTDLDLPNVPEHLRPTARERKPRQSHTNGSNSPKGAAEHAGEGIVDPVDLPELRAALFAVSPDDYDTWYKCLAALKRDLGEEGRDLALAWTESGKREDLQERRLDRFDTKWDKDIDSITDVHLGSIFHFANEADPNWRDKIELNATDEHAKADSSVKDDSADAKADAPEQPATAKADAWPTMAEAAYHGIIGQLVKTIEPETEADPVAILIQLIVAIGNMMGRKAYYQVESDRHHPNLFAAAVGDTSKARKGTSWGRVRGVAYHADQEWVVNHIGSGLSSGEGLIHQVRDPVIKIKDGEREIVDAGVTDKRFMAYEAELSSLLKVMERAGSTINALFRKAWDGGDLQTLTRSSTLRATAPHISSIAHITIEELRSCLTRTDAANGFANRFLFFLARRSKELPMGGSLDDLVIMDLGKRIGSAINHFMEIGRVRFTPEGEARWREVYGRLTRGHPGMFGAITARAEAQVIRIALVYAVMDRSMLIDAPHVEAGLAVWDYCERSAKYIFGEMIGDHAADTILTGLKQVYPAGMSRSEIYKDLFGGNARANTIAAALVRLKGLGLAKVDVIKPAGVLGKPTEVWSYTPPD